MLIENLYVINYKDDDKAVIKLCDEDHPIFKAHFPGKPILPGFVNFDIVSEIFDLQITTIKRAKFLKLIYPNQVLTYIKKDKSFKVYCDENEVASFIL